MIVAQKFFELSQEAANTKRICQQRAFVYNAGHVVRILE